jgi:uncharacterized phage-associated protein
MLHAHVSVARVIDLHVAVGPSGGAIRVTLGNRAPSHESSLYSVFMSSVHDVASYILRKQGSMSTWKLQKLVYYAQAWSLVWDEKPLYAARIEAWANGPVVKALSDKHRGRFSVDSWPYGDGGKLTDAQRDTIDRVLADYGKLSGRQLSLLAHADRPWRDAREGLGPTDPGDREISLQSMQAYYEALDADESVPVVGDIDWSALEAA